MSEPFTGFSNATFSFLAGLEAENTKTYFDANRKTYEEHVKAPMRSLVTAVATELQNSVSPGVEGDPRVGRSLFRINRDIRFAQDKTPYNPWVDAIWWEGDFPPRHAPVFLLRIASDHAFVGSGITGMRGEILDRYRMAVAEDRSGRELELALERIVELRPLIEFSEPTRKRVPGGYPQDHQSDVAQTRHVPRLTAVSHPRRSENRGIPAMAARHVRRARAHSSMVHREPHPAGPIADLTIPTQQTPLVCACRNLRHQRKKPESSGKPRATLTLCPEWSSMVSRRRRVSFLASLRPDVFLAAAAELGVPPRRCIVVEDALSGVAAGAAGGFGLVIGVARHDNRNELLAAGADAVFPDLSAVRVGTRRKRDTM